MRWVLGLTVGAVGLLLGAPLTHAQEWTEGKHYFEIKPAQRPPDAPAGVVEVTEVFSYACIHCNRATPLMEKIKKSLPVERAPGLPARLLQFLRVVADVPARLLHGRRARRPAEDA